MREIKEFTKGQPVRCIDARMDGCGPALDEGKVYTIRKFTPPDQCERNHCQWELHGGRVELMEFPGGPSAGFYGRRFLPASLKQVKAHTPRTE